MAIRLVPALLAALSLASSVAASAADMNQVELKKKLKMEDEAYRNLRSARTQSVAPSEDVKDWRGHNLRDDLQENIVTPDASAHIESQLQGAKEALQRDDLEAARVLANDVFVELASEAINYNDIRLYWNKWVSRAPTRRAYRENLAKSGIERTHAAEIDEAESRFERQIEARQFVAAMTESYPTLEELYERAANDDETVIAAAIEQGRFTPLLSQKASSPCRNRPPSNSGSGKPKFYKVGPMHEDYYPAPSKALGEEGIVRMYVRVSEAGCVTEAMMTSSSGYPRLDAAALEIAINALYMPAEVDGHAVAKNVPFKFAFKLRD